MKSQRNNIKIIFGLKLKQLRQDKNLSFASLSERSGLSLSYLNEIESGKKYPKTDKIAILAEALGVSYDKLVSLKLTRNLAPLGDFLNSKVLEQLPLDHYGIDINKIIILMANAPLQLSALVTTLIEMAKSSELSQNNFSRTAIRTYKEFNENYFDDLEKEVQNFSQKINIDNSPPLSYNDLKKIIFNQFKIEIDETHLNNYPELSEVRGVYIPGNTKKLVINNKLNNSQKTFLIGKEIAYHHLNISERSNVYSSTRVDSFDQLLNNLRASYFSTALMLKKENVIEDLTKFFSTKNWNGKNLLKLIRKYNATPEIFFQRITNLASKFFGLNGYFFLRFNTRENSEKFNLNKELRLNTYENPGGYQSAEHYCRRWISINVLKQLDKEIKKNQNFDELIIGAQVSEFYNSKDRYFSISIAGRSKLIGGINTSVTLGFQNNDEFKKRINFWNDRNVPVRVVNDTCEKCTIEDCKERVVPPVVADEQIKYSNRKAALEKLISEVSD